LYALWEFKVFAHTFKESVPLGWEHASLSICAPWPVLCFLAFTAGLYYRAGTGAYIWLMILTLPVGFVLVVIGLVLKVIQIKRS
jgi:hypothetical protein